jgi:hypothetical protein
MRLEQPFIEEKEQQSLKGIEKESVNPKKLFLYDTN